jgi:hypothetical protein
MVYATGTRLSKSVRAFHCNVHESAVTTMTCWLLEKVRDELRQFAKLWSAETGLRFRRLTDWSVKQSRVQRLGRTL